MELQEMPQRRREVTIEAPDGPARCSCAYGSTFTTIYTKVLLLKET